MARKQFVSSMKNAPSRAVSSKEAALQGRGSGGDGDLSDDDDLVSDGDDETASLNGDDDAAHARGAASPVSSAASSPVSSDDEDDDDDDDEANGKDGAHDDQDDDPAEHEDGDGDDLAVAVQVMPASVGRGKQLRFPTAISRGKEARILHNGSDRDGSDSESYASVASDEEEDNDDEMMAATTTTATSVGVAEAVASPAKSPVSTQRETEEQGEEDGEEEDDTVYPIKAFRARKRHRPDSGYFTQMSTHVRDCLLSIRDVSTAEALSEEAHNDFRRKLSAGTVERVPWKQVSPPPPAAAPSDSEKKVPKASPERESSSSSERKRARDEKEGRSSSSRKGDERSDRRADKSSRSSADQDAADRKKERSGKENDSRSSSSRRDEKDSSRSSSDKKDPRESSEKSKSSKSSSSSSKRVEENGHGGSSKADKTVREDVLCAKCKKSVSEQNADEAQRKASVEATAKAAALQAAAAQATLDAAAATAAAAAAARTPAPAATNPAPVPPGTFILTPNATREISQMREEAARLNDEARSLKHEGNRRGVADPGPAGQAAQGRYYLRSSAKFFQHALLLADIKAAYREAGDERSARTYGDYCMQTLAQTSSLIESTVRKMRTAGNGRLVALGYKLTSIVELTIYRLQHVKLFSIYSNLYTPGRSPDSRQNGTTPPINGSGSDSQDTAMKALLLKEMEHTLRGFEMWQRYEMCPEEVLPRITNPAVVDLPALFEDLAAELGQS